MGYSKYKSLRQVANRFNLSVQRAVFFNEVREIKSSSWLTQTLNLASSLPLSNEKTKSERLIAPILMEVYQMHKDRLTLFSGEELNVEPENDLNGACDFFFSAKANAYLLEAPIVSLTEAKDEDMDYGIAQCTAQLIGAQKFNAQQNAEVPVLWGCSTTAGEWKFLKLEGKDLYIDLDSYYIVKLEQLLGVFSKILS
ncbi:MAG: hypothetical protein AAGG68_05765 [Bacteroidota bacterium]